MKSYLLLAIFGLLAACGGNQSKKNDAINKKKVGNSTAHQYEREDPTCTPQTGILIEQGEFFSAENGETYVLPGKLIETKGHPSLSGRHIFKTHYGLESQPLWNGTRVEDTITQPGTPLPICRSSGIYERTSIEGIALTSYSHLEQVFYHYGAVPSAKAFKPIELMILPKFMEKNGPVTDNLAYHTKLKAVIVYPKGEIGNRIWPETNLWESPWIISHEGAHHLFQTHFFGMLESQVNSLIKQEPVLPILKHKPLRHGPQIEQNTATERKVDAGDIIGSVNEGFADLFAFYAVNENSKNINGMTCFTKGRDLLSETFATGDRKALTTAAIGDFFATYEISRTAPSGFYSCDVPDYQDIHHVGAVIVHGLHGIYTASARARNAAEPLKEKANMALQWVDRMALHVIAEVNRLNHLPANSDLLRNVVLEGIKVATPDGKTLNSEQCAVMDRVFPAYAPIWKSSGSLVCGS